MLAGIVALSAGAFALSMHWWNEAFAPMTTERYAALCDDLPECYPEAGYLVGSIFAAVVGFAAAVGLFLGVVLDRLSRSASGRSPVSPYRGPPLG